MNSREVSLRLLARCFRVRVSFIARLLHRRRHTGSLELPPHGGGHPPARNALLLRDDLHRIGGGQGSLGVRAEHGENVIAVTRGVPSKTPAAFLYQRGSD